LRTLRAFASWRRWKIEPASSPSRKVATAAAIIEVRKTWRHATPGKTLYQAVTTFGEDQ